MNTSCLLTSSINLTNFKKQVQSSFNVLELFSEITDEQLMSYESINSLVDELYEKCPQQDMSSINLMDTIDMNIFPSYREDIRRIAEVEIFTLALTNYYKQHYPAVSTESDEFRHVITEIRKRYKSQTSLSRPKGNTYLFRSLISNDRNIYINHVKPFDDVMLFGYIYHELNVPYKKPERDNKEPLWYNILFNSSQLQRFVHEEAERTLESVVSHLNHDITLSIELIKRNETENKTFDSDLYEILYSFAQGYSSYNKVMLNAIVPVFSFKNYNEALKVIEWFDLLTPIEIDRTDLVKFWLLQKYNHLTIDSILDSIQYASVDIYNNRRPVSSCINIEAKQ